MKSFLKSGLYVFTFAIAGILFQLACSNSDDVNFVSTSELGNLVYEKQSATGSAIYISNYDGTNEVQVPITLPSNLHFSTLNGNGAQPRMSPSGTKLFFLLSDDNDTTISSSIYSCDIDGTNLQEVISSTSTNTVNLGGVY